MGSLGAPGRPGRWDQNRGNKWTLSREEATFSRFWMINWALLGTETSHGSSSPAKDRLRGLGSCVLGPPESAAALTSHGHGLDKSRRTNHRRLPVFFKNKDQMQHGHREVGDILTKERVVHLCSLFWSDSDGRRGRAVKLHLSLHSLHVFRFIFIQL